MKYKLTRHFIYPFDPTGFEKAPTGEGDSSSESRIVKDSSDIIFEITDNVPIAPVAPVVGKDVLDALLFESEEPEPSAASQTLTQPEEPASYEVSDLPTESEAVAEAVAEPLPIVDAEPTVQAEDKPSAEAEGEPEAEPVGEKTVVAGSSFLSDKDTGASSTRVMDPLDFSDEEEEEEQEATGGKGLGKIAVIILAILGVLLLLFGAVQLLLYNGHTKLLGMNLRKLDFFGMSPIVYEELTVEIGSEEISADDFIDQSRNTDHASAVFTRTGYDLGKIGNYSLSLRFEGRDYTVMLNVVDRVAPSGSVKVALIPVGGELSEDDLVSDISDSTVVSVFVSKFDNTKPGVQDITVRLVDEGNNATEYHTRVYIAEEICDVVYEAGGELPTADRFLKGIDGLALAESFAALPLNQPGTYTAELICGEDKLELPFKVQDTVAPQVSVRDDLELISSVLPDAATLLSKVEDATETTAAYKEEYRFEKDGRYDVTVVVTDLGGNQTEVTVPVFIYFSDVVTDAPMIIASDFTVEIGQSIPYRQYIRIIDGVDGEYDLYDTTHVTFDQNAVNNSVTGTYALTVKAVDSEGNSSSKVIQVSVIHKRISQQEVNAFVKEILADIITAGMSREQQLRAVFDYITKQSGMTYTGSSDKDNLYYVEAYYGFTMKVGDCYTYCSMSRVMLDCLNIDYYEVKRSGTRHSNHYWLLADFGDGWYHFDTCYHVVRWTKDTFKLTDAEVAAFTKWYNTKYSGWNYYQFDHSLYPATPVLNADGKTYTYTPYVVTYNAEVGGSIVGESFQKVDHGKQSAKVTAVPAEGYVFKGWSDGVITASRSDLIKSNLNVIAEFAAGTLPTKSYLLTYTAGTGGSIEGKASQNVYEGYYGSTVTAVPQSGYVFKGWSDGVTTASRTDKAEANLAVSAVFEKDGKSYTLLYMAGNGGTITGTTTQTVASGKKGSPVTAVPQTGYLFGGWSDGVTTATRTDTATKDLTVTAQFKKDSASYTLKYVAGSGGKIDGNATQTVASGAVGSPVTAVADHGYVFKDWSDGYQAATRKGDVASKDQTFTANFEPDPSFHKIVYKATTGGSISGKTEQMLNIGDTTEKVTAVADTGYQFDRWSDGLLTAERSDRVEAAATYTAIFKAKESVVHFVAGEGGSISGETEQSIAGGEKCSAVTASANEGYVFIGWYVGDTLVSSDVTISYAPTGDTTVTARFDKLYTYRFVAGEGGSIEGEATQHLASGVRGTSVKAIPAEGYHFVKWTVEGGSNSYTGSTLTLSGSDWATGTSTTVVANFEADAAE